MSNIEQDTRFIVNNNLINKGWILDIQDPNKNVFFESDILRIVNNEFLKKSKKRPDYVLFDSQNKRPIGVIETKSGGKSLTKALDQATEYAEMLDAPLIFAMNNGFCETRHLYTQKPLFIDENEVNELIRVNEAKEFILQETNGIYITPKEILVSRKELINVFKKLNNSLRGEGLRAGIERLSEFANILFLKLYTENANTGIWNSLKSLDNDLLINTTNN
ncbi:type I restriction endonuclease, partial [Acinetobacter baumannii]